jgi:hypothetical protein
MAEIAMIAAILSSCRFTVGISSVVCLGPCGEQHQFPSSQLDVILSCTSFPL